MISPVGLVYLTGWISLTRRGSMTRCTWTVILHPRQYTARSSPWLFEIFSRLFVRWRTIVLLLPIARQRHVYVPQFNGDSTTVLIDPHRCTVNYIDTYGNFILTLTSYYYIEKENSFSVFSYFFYFFFFIFLFFVFHFLRFASKLLKVYTSNNVGYIISEFREFRRFIRRTNERTNGKIYFFDLLRSINVAHR